MVTFRAYIPFSGLRKLAGQQTQTCADLSVLIPLQRLTHCTQWFLPGSRRASNEFLVLSPWKQNVYRELIISELPGQDRNKEFHNYNGFSHKSLLGRMTLGLTCLSYTFQK